MQQFCETLEGRTLFSVSAPVSQVDSALETLKADFATNAATYISDAGAINADTRALPKNKINAKDVAALHRTVTLANASDVANSARYFATVRLGLVRAQATYSAVVRRPTSAGIRRLNAVLTSVENTSAAAEGRLNTSIGTGNTKVAAALNLLVSVNSTDTQFATDVDTSDTAHATGQDAIVAQLGVIASDIQALVTDYSFE